jgi:7,8-dihydroneopterin aldolase/epimerase/oxygenase
MSGRIALEGLEFHAFHGVYPHERESGNWFEVDIAVETNFTRAADHDELSETVNYVTLFKIIKDEMEIPSKLLETVAENIVDEVLKTFPQIKAVEFKISKLNPPIGGKCHKASVTLRKEQRA